MMKETFPQPEPLSRKERDTVMRTSRIEGVDNRGSHSISSHTDDNEKLMRIRQEIKESEIEVPPTKEEVTPTSTMFSQKVPRNKKGMWLSLLAAFGLGAGGAHGDPKDAEFHTNPGHSTQKNSESVAINTSTNTTPVYQYKGSFSKESTGITHSTNTHNENSATTKTPIFYPGQDVGAPPRYAGGVAMGEKPTQASEPSPHRGYEAAVTRSTKKIKIPILGEIDVRSTHERYPGPPPVVERYEISPETSTTVVLDRRGKRVYKQEIPGRTVEIRKYPGQK